MPTKRQLLVRRNFEAYRDLTWFEELEPKFREKGIDGKQLQSFREMWNEHAEKRDWAWWQKKTARERSGRLPGSIVDLPGDDDRRACRPSRRHPLGGFPVSNERLIHDVSFAGAYYMMELIAGNIDKKQYPDTLQQIYERIKATIEAYERAVDRMNKRLRPVKN